MKTQTKLVATVCAMASALSSLAANATITDSLTGPSGIITTTSALTVSTGTAPASSSPYVYYSRYDDAASHDLGNARFNASYNVYSYTGAPSAGTAEAYESFSADATAFGTTKNVLNGYQYAYTSVPGQSANLYYYVYALGNQVRGGSRTGGDFNGTTYLSSINQQFWSASQNFSISIIPVTVSAAIYGSAYQSVSGHFWVDGADGVLSEGVRAWVKASAGVGISGASAGLRVDNLNLIDVSIPLQAKARYSNSWATGACTSDFTLASRFNLGLRFLNGQLKAYAEFLFWGDEYLLASWPGIYQNFTLLNYPATVRSNFYSCISVPAAPQIAGIIIG